jgi:3-oxoacyl-[acyl-carrier protein] reductase
MTATLSNKVAIVTGGSRGIGANIATEFAKRGAKVSPILHTYLGTGFLTSLHGQVAITYVSNQKAAEDVASEIKALNGEVVTIQADMRDMEASNKIVETTMKAFNTDGIDILGSYFNIRLLSTFYFWPIAVNNAASGKMLDFMKTDLEVYNDMFEINVRGPIFLVQAVLPVIRRGGRIINISSLAARDRMPCQFTLYSATKAAIEGMTRSWAFSYAGEKDITVNAIVPGPVETGMFLVMPTWHLRLTFIYL